MNKIVVSNDYLPYFIDEELYIVEENFKEKVIETERHLASVEVDTSIVSLPNLVNNLLVIIRFENDSEPIANYKIFLSKLLAAAGQNIKTTDVVVMNKFKEIKAKTIIERSAANNVIAFGVDVQNPENFQLRHFNGKKILISSRIELLPESKPRKSKLWNLMKEMLNLQ